MGRRLLSLLASSGFFIRHPGTVEELANRIDDAANDTAEALWAEAIEAPIVAEVRQALGALEEELSARPVRVPRAAGEGAGDAGR
jgi:4-hydroxyphenylpyruvate dioxygenase-like putative hemolysin